MKTCNDCKHSKSCIMSAPDGKWAACEKFEGKEMDLISREQAMAFPNTWKEFEEEYGFTDKDNTYTNGSRLIPSFRVKQWLEHIARPKGEWIDSIEHDGWFCSKCGYSITSRYGKYNYCPNCGSRMGA